MSSTMVPSAMQRMAFPILNRLPFDDGLTRSSASPARLHEILSAPAPGSNQRKSVLQQSNPQSNPQPPQKSHSSPLAPPPAHPRPAIAPQDPPIFKKQKSKHSKHSKPLSHSSPLPDDQPKSKRRLKEEAKAAAWQAKITQRRAEERAQAEKEGKLDEFEAVRIRKEEQIAASKATKQHQPQQPQQPQPQPQNPKKRHSVEREEGAGADGAGSRKRKMSATESLPLLNGAPVVYQKAHIAQIKQQAVKLMAGRRKLPIWAHQKDLQKCLCEKDVLIMLGQTGSGKSTQLAQFLLEEPWMKRKGKVGGCIAITQPRRVAATSLAKRVAQEMGVRLGEEVGYSVRFDNRSGKDTKIKFLTDGMLMQEMLRDPELKQYSAVFVDEAHERTVDTDLVMGFLRDLVYGERRGSLKVVIMSATLEVETIAKYYEEFHGEKVLEEVQAAEAAQKEVVAEKLVEEALKKEPEVKPEQAVTPPASSPDKSQEKKKRKKKKKKKNSTLDLIRTPSPGPESEKPVVVAEPVIKDDPEPKEYYRYYGTTAVFLVPGRQFEVEMFHSPEPVTDYIDTILKVVLQVHVREPLPGDILVFLTGQDEIDNLQKLLEDYALQLEKTVPKLQIFPLYSALPFSQQQRVFIPTPPRTRKVILSTNIAETSVTVSGVRHVVDCGKSKQKRFRPAISLESLLVEPISRSSAMQRAGRAGREAPGKCYRIYTEETFAELDENTTPEILRCDLAHAILRLKARGVEDITKFSYLTTPPQESLFKALEQLLMLGALDTTGAITSLGRKMSSLPLTPPLARVLLAAAQPEFDCLAEAIDIIAILQSGDSPFLPRPFKEEENEKWEEAMKLFRRYEGDHLMILELFRAYTTVASPERVSWCKTHFIAHRTMSVALETRKQLRVYSSRFSDSLKPTTSTSTSTSTSTTEPSTNNPAISPDLAERILKSFLRGYFANTARLQRDGRSYVTVVAGQDVMIHPSSSLMGEKREAVLFQEFVFTTRPWGRVCSGVRMDWVMDAINKEIAVEGEGEEEGV